MHPLRREQRYCERKLKQRFKTVLPMCKLCLDNGKEPFTHRYCMEGDKSKFFFVIVLL